MASSLLLLSPSQIPVLNFASISVWPCLWSPRQRVLVFHSTIHANTAWQVLTFFLSLASNASRVVLIYPCTSCKAFSTRPLLCDSHCGLHTGTVPLGLFAATCLCTSAMAASWSAFKGFLAPPYPSSTVSANAPDATHRTPFPLHFTWGAWTLFCIPKLTHEFADISVPSHLRTLFFAKPLPPSGGPSAVPQFLSPAAVLPQAFWLAALAPSNPPCCCFGRYSFCILGLAEHLPVWINPAPDTQRQSYARKRASDSPPNSDSIKNPNTAQPCFPSSFTKEGGGCLRSVPLMGPRSCSTLDPPTRWTSAHIDSSCLSSAFLLSYDSTIELRYSTSC